MTTPAPYASVTTTTDWTMAEDSLGAVYFSRITDESDPAYRLSTPQTYTLANLISEWDSQLRTTTDITQRLRIQTPSAGSQLAMFKFFGIPAAEGQHAFAVGAIWGVNGLVQDSTTEFVADYLGRFDLTLGTAAAAGIIPDPESLEPVFARRASVQIDRASFPGFRVAGHATSIPSEAGPVLLVDCFGYSYLIVELRCTQPSYSLGGPAQKVGFLYRFA